MKNVKRFLSVFALAGFAGVAMAQCPAGTTDVQVGQFDSFGDGWNGNTMTITDGSGSGAVVATLGGPAGSVVVDTLCLADDCYEAVVDGGAFQFEVSWDITVGGVGAASGGAPETAFFTVGAGVCEIQGCTDPDAINFDPAATVDDGSCIEAAENDQCDDAEEVECGDEIDGSTSAGTLDQNAIDAGFCGTGITAPGVWYTFESAGENATFDLCTTDYDSKINVFSGECDNLTCLGGNDDSFANCGAGGASFLGNVLLPDGEIIYVLVQGFSSNTGDFTLTIECEEVVEIENDFCDDAEELECGDSVDGTTLNAQTEDVTGTTCGTSISAGGVWYQMEVSENELWNISVCNAANFDTKLSVWSGDDCDDLTCVGGNDDNFTAGCTGNTSEFEFLATEDQIIYVLVHGFLSAQGDFTLTVNCEEFETVENDVCDDAEEIECGGSVEGSTEGAFEDSAEAPFCGTSVTAPGVWYVIETGGECITASLCSGATAYDSKLSVYTGDCSALVCVDGNDDSCGLQSEVNFTGTDGEMFWILVHGFGGASGEFELEVICEDPPANDNVCDATALTVNSPEAYDNACSSADAGEITPGGGTGASACDSQDGWCDILGEPVANNSLWFTVTVPASGSINIATDNTNDLQLAVYEVGDCADYGTFTVVAANDDGGAGLAPELNMFCLTAGTELYIQLDGFSGAESAGNITVTDLGAAPLTCAIDGCLDVFVGGGLINNCTELTASAAGGFAPYTITWNDGDQDLTVVHCPDSTTNYSITVVDSVGCEVICEVTVNVTDITCGNSSSSSKSSSSNSGSSNSSSSSMGGWGNGSSSAAVSHSSSSNSSSSSISCPSSSSHSGSSSSSAKNDKVYMCDDRGITRCVPAKQISKKTDRGWTLGDCASARGAECDLTGNDVEDVDCLCDKWMGALRLQYVGPDGGQLMATNCGDTLYNTADIAASCEITIEMQDSFGDSWNGASLSVDVNGTATTVTHGGGASSSEVVAVTGGDDISLTYTAGTFEEEVSYTVLAADGSELFADDGTDGTDPATGLVFQGVADCGASPGLATGDIFEVYAQDSVQFNARFITLTDAAGNEVTIDTKCPKLCAPKVSSSSNSSSSNSGWGSSSDAMDANPWMSHSSSSKSGSCVPDSGATIQGDRFYPYDVIGYIDMSGNRCNWPSCEDVSIDLLTDNFGTETSFSLVDLTTGTEVVGLAQGDQASATLVTYDAGCLETGDNCYEFTINDSFGDGICCAFGEGAWTINVGGAAVATGGEFDDSETAQFGACTADSSAKAIDNSVVAASASISAYPNPFSSSTNISFTLPSDDQAVVEIMTLKGERVAVLFNGAVAANTAMTIEFDSNELADGIYFYKLTTEGGVVKNGKLVLQH